MDDSLRLANKLNEVVVGNLTCIQNWGVYLFDDDFEKEVELRNKVGTIWLCALLDTVEAESKVIDDALNKAEGCGFDSLVHNATQLKKFCRLTSELLELFTREEQIFLVDLRNQWVHGYLSSRQKEEVSVKFSKDGVIVRDKVSRLGYAEIMEGFYGRGSIDQILQPLIARALDKQHLYWQAIGKIQVERDEIYRCLREDECFNILV